LQLLVGSASGDTRSHQQDQQSEAVKPGVTAITNHADAGSSNSKAAKAPTSTSAKAGVLQTTGSRQTLTFSTQVSFRPRPA